jgi:hypothetical protein
MAGGISKMNHLERFKTKNHLTEVEPKLYLLTAFSIGMIPNNSLTIVEFEGISCKEAAEILLEQGFESAVGHKATAKILSEKFKFFVPSDRKQVKLNRNDSAIVVSIAMRLPEGKVLSLAELRECPLSFYLARVVSQVNAPEVASDVLDSVMPSKHEGSN